VLRGLCFLEKKSKWHRGAVPVDVTSPFSSRSKILGCDRAMFRGTEQEHVSRCHGRGFNNRDIWALREKLVADQSRLQGKSTYCGSLLRGWQLTSEGGPWVAQRV